MEKKTIIVGVASFVAGVAAGFAGNTLIRKFKERRAEKKAAEEKTEDDSKEDHSSSSEVDLSDPENRKKEFEARKEAVTQYKDIASTYTPYHKITKEQTEKELAEKEHPEDDTIFDDIPYSITGEQYLHENPGFQKVTWTYYMKDDTFADEHEEIIPDYEQYIGYAPETFLDLGFANGDYIYVRNERLSTDIEIVKNQGSYKTEVLGEE